MGLYSDVLPNLPGPHLPHSVLCRYQVVGLGEDEVR